MVESEVIAAIGKHQDPRQQEKHIAEEHHPAQSTDGEVTTLVALHHLHRGKPQGSQTIDIGSTRPGQQRDACPDGHQGSAQKIDHGLYLIQ